MKKKPFYSKKLLWYILSALLACAILGGPFVYFRSYKSSPLGKPNITKNAAMTENACVIEDLTPIAGNSARDFPLLAACYAGTISILGISTSETNLFLFEIQQSQDIFTGKCNGFGTFGTFSGSIT